MSIDDFEMLMRIIENGIQEGKESAKSGDAPEEGEITITYNRLEGGISFNAKDLSRTEIVGILQSSFEDSLKDLEKFASTNITANIFQNPEDEEVH